MVENAHRSGRQDRLGHPGLRPRRTRCASPTEIPAEEGVVVVVEVLTNKSTYNTLELTSGRMAKVGKGDIVAGALGHRKALFGYSGHVPETRASPATSSRCSTSAACSGICDSVNPDKGKPFDCRVLGVVLHFPYLGERIGVPARVGYAQLDYDATLDTQRRAGGGAGRHLHGSRQDRGGLRHRRAHAPSRPHRRRVQGDGRLAAPRHPGDGGCRRAQRADLHRPRHRHRPRGKIGPALTRTMLTELAARQARRASCSSWATACSAPTASMRSSSARTSARR